MQRNTFPHGAKEELPRLPCPPDPPRPRQDYSAGCPGGVGERPDRPRAQVIDEATAGRLQLRIFLQILGDPAEKSGGVIAAEAAKEGN